MKSDLESKAIGVVGRQAEAPRPRTLGGYLMLGAAFITCPCHLPILAALLAGTAVGAHLKDNLALTAIGLTALFVTSLILGLRWISSGDKARIR